MNSVPSRRWAKRASLSTLVVVGGLSLLPASGSAADAPVTALSATPAPLTFDNVLPGGSATKTFTVTNTGTSPATIAAVSNQGRDAADFGVGTQTCTSTALPVGGTCTVAVRFAPTIDGTRISNIRLDGSSGCVVYVNIAGGAEKASPQQQIGTSSCSVPTSAAVAASAASSSAAPPAASSTGTGGVLSTTVVSATSPKICASRRVVTVHVRPRAGVPLKRVSFRLNGKVIRTVTASTKTPIATKVDLRGLPRGRFALTIRATTTTGRTYERVQHFVTCVAKKGPALG